MASVTFSVSVGGDGSTVSDDSNPTTGLASGGHRTRFVPALGQIVGIGQYVVNQAAAANASAVAAAASAASAVNAPGTNGTSSTSLIVSPVSKTFTTQTGKNFVLGQPVMIARTADPGGTWMAGNITAYNSGTGSMTVDVVWTRGSGTHSDWTISLAAPANPAAVSKGGDSMTGALTVPGLFVTGTAEIPDTVVSINTSMPAAAYRTYLLTANLTLTLPANPVAGAWVRVINRSGVFTCNVARNGQNIMSLAEDMLIDFSSTAFTLVFVDATRGWVLI